MPTLGLFRKAKKQEPQEPTEAVEEHPVASPASPSTESTDNIYLKALPLREVSDLETIKSEVEKGNILILRITPLASKSIEDVKQAVGELQEFAELIGGDIARLGEERVVICPPKVRIWREKTPAQNKPLPTAA